MSDKVPRSKQETIVSYDVEKNKWHIHTNYPKIIRICAPLLDEMGKNDELPEKIDIDVDAGRLSPNYRLDRSVEFVMKSAGEQLKECDIDMVDKNNLTACMIKNVVEGNYKAADEIRQQMGISKSINELITEVRHEG